MASTFVFLIEQLAPGLYILVGLAILFYARQWQRARRAYRSTTFALERNVLRYRSGGALMAMAMLMEAGLVIAGIQQVVAPTVREDRARAGIVDSFQGSRDDGVFSTPAPSPPSGVLTLDMGREYPLGVEQEFTIRLTPIPTNTPVGTIEAAEDPFGCGTPYATLQIPANGMRVFQTIPVMGTAYHENFSSYRLELSGPGTLNQYVTLDEGTIPVETTGSLSQFDPAPYQPGTYRFRVRVFDTTTTLQAHCEITISITAPIPTPTPF